MAINLFFIHHGELHDRLLFAELLRFLKFECKYLVRFSRENDGLFAWIKCKVEAEGVLFLCAMKMTIKVHSRIDFQILTWLKVHITFGKYHYGRDFHWVAMKHPVLMPQKMFLLCVEAAIEVDVAPFGTWLSCTKWNYCCKNLFSETQPSKKDPFS